MSGPAEGTWRELSWSANLSLLFTEVPFLERFGAAREAGFRAVEFWWPHGHELQEVVRARRESGLQVALFNMDGGDLAAGERGFASHPQRREWWWERFELALELAGELEARRINVLAGNRMPGLAQEEQLKVLVENLRRAGAAAREVQVILLLEPLNPLENPDYLLPTTAHAVEVLSRLDGPVSLQLDLYHAQRTEGNLTALLETHHQRLGHVQIADCPGRHEPGTGEVRWPFVLGRLAELGYDGYVGLEYVPSGSTQDSLRWLR